MDKTLLNKIHEGLDLEETIKNCITRLYYDGPKNNGLLETISTIKYFHGEVFKRFEDEINMSMGLFYKDLNVQSLRSEIFKINASIINAKMNRRFTPVQAEMIEKSNSNRIFSFSSGTSVGKSFVFRELLLHYNNDVVIIVPSRALINEYMLLLEENLNLKEVNLLQHVDFINKKNVKRNIFVLTPERAKSVFNEKDNFNLDLVLFDEAQLGNEKSMRGVLFDGIVRRFNNEFQGIKILFAHPFVLNPSAQITRNNLLDGKSESKVYFYKNVGQIYLSYENNRFYQFPIDKELLGNYKVELTFDPVEKTLSEGGSVLIYMTKAKIIRKDYIQDLRKYRKHFGRVKSEEGIRIIGEVQEMLGVTRLKDSFLLRLMKLGIVFHHGSMPLDLRRKIEKFINDGYSKVCIATSTLYQGINMPFDLVWLDRLDSSKPLGVKNLIGRAGRASLSSEFDYGIVLVKEQSKSDFRNLMNHEEFIGDKSNIDTDFGSSEIDVSELKDAIKNNDFSDKYNLTNNEVANLKSSDLKEVIVNILDVLFAKGDLIAYESFKGFSSEKKNEIKTMFMQIYQKHLRRKELTLGEKDVLFEGLQILLWTILGKSFKQIAALRYLFTIKFFDEEVNDLRRKAEVNHEGRSEYYFDLLSKISAKYLVGYNEIPNINLARFPKFRNINILEVDYDTVIFDTYDFMDKLITLRLKDVFFAAFNEYWLMTNDNRAEVLGNLIKYGTNNPKRIWLQRYGFLNDEVDQLVEFVKSVDENEIIFENSIYEAELRIETLKRYI